VKNDHAFPVQVKHSLNEDRFLSDNSVLPFYSHRQSNKCLTREMEPITLILSREEIFSFLSISNRYVQSGGACSHDEKTHDVDGIGDPGGFRRRSGLCETH
jgi:hypothetical protein